MSEEQQKPEGDAQDPGPTEPTDETGSDLIPDVTSDSGLSTMDLTPTLKGWDEIARRTSNIDAFVTAVSPAIKNLDTDAWKNLNLGATSAAYNEAFKNFTIPKTNLPDFSKANSDAFAKLNEAVKAARIDLGVNREILGGIARASAPMRNDIAPLNSAPVLPADDDWAVEALDISQPELDAMQAMVDLLGQMTEQARQDAADAQIREDASKTRFTITTWLAAAALLAAIAAVWVSV